MSPNKATYSLLFCRAPSSGTGSFKRTGGKKRGWEGKRRESVGRKRGREGEKTGRKGKGKRREGKGRAGSGEAAAGSSTPGQAGGRRVQNRGADSSRPSLLPPRVPPAATATAAAGSAPGRGEIPPPPPPAPALPRPPDNGGWGVWESRGAQQRRLRDSQSCSALSIYREGDSPSCKNSLSLGSGHAPNSWRRPPPPPLSPHPAPGEK